MNPSEIGTKAWAMTSSFGNFLIETPKGYYKGIVTNWSDIKVDFTSSSYTESKKVKELTVRLMDVIAAVQLIVGTSLIFTASLYLRSYVTTTAWILSPVTFITSVFAGVIFWDLKHSYTALAKAHDWMIEKAPSDSFIINNDTSKEWQKFAKHLKHHTWIVEPLLRQNLNNVSNFINDNKTNLMWIHVNKARKHLTVKSAKTLLSTHPKIAAGTGISCGSFFLWYFPTTAMLLGTVTGLQWKFNLISKAQTLYQNKQQTTA